MQRLEAGEAITLATIGGSITTGYAAQPPRELGWAALLAKSLGAKVRLVNAGLSGTDSAAGVQRLQAHVLDQSPDLVIVEFGVNDQWLDPGVRGSSFEAILRRLLSAEQPPAVVVLGLIQQGNQARDAVDLQLKLAAHYGLTALDFGRWMHNRVEAGLDRWAALYDEPVHPNATGHERIAQALAQTLRTERLLPPLRALRETLQQNSKRGTARRLPGPLHGRAHEFTRLLTGDTLRPYQSHGFERGGEVHPEWTGQQPGWVAKAEDAEARFLVYGREVAVFHAESEHYRNLEARVDDGPWVSVQGHVAERKGYLGWRYTVVGRDLEPGAHLLQVRVRRDEWKGSGRPASLLAVMSAGIFPPELHPSAFVRTTPSAAPALISPDDGRLRWIGRIAAAPGAAKLLAWSGTEMRARFTGDQLTLRLAPWRGGISHFTVEVDGQRHALALRGQGPADWQLQLPPGQHELRLLKRTEASQAEALFLGLRLAAGGKLLDPPPPRPLKLVFYGDSITAGACNGDIGEDQYADLSTHDGTRAYGAVTAANLGADYVGIAVSGIGITATWDQLLMPEVWHRFAPRLDAAIAPPDPRAPDVVLLNLGQNDHGFPASMGQPMAADFGTRYLGFVRQLRGRYPHAGLVLLTGGMTAPREQPAIARAVLGAVQALRGEGDAKVWSYHFEAFAWAHPRIDVHAQMADELTRFLNDEVLR
ncbi:MAG: GDSL-type esterase/lipase family protein [Roseateles sp.]|uniref:GDSL-type esterase/lipase family protein n=1 Tax=Roseateles sp. TaxID=1971397 RepID=UPI00403525F5